MLLQAARADASTGLLDIGRLGHMLSRISGQITHCRLDRVAAGRAGADGNGQGTDEMTDDGLLGEAAARNTRLIMEASGLMGEARTG